MTKPPLAQLYDDTETSTLELLRREGFTDLVIERFFRPFLGGVFLERDLATSSRKFAFVFRMFATGQAALPAKGTVRRGESARRGAGRGMTGLETLFTDFFDLPGGLPALGCWC